VTAIDDTKPRTTESRTTESRTTELHETAASLVAHGRGILAVDESIATMSKRLEGAGVVASAQTRRDYRALLLTTPGLSRWVTAVILCDETLRQQLADGTPVPEACLKHGILPGIKVDTGTTPLPGTGGALVTEGLDGLPGRLAAYREMGAVFAKWRAVVAPDRCDRRAVRANAHALARYAAACQEAGIVPIVEPEVLMDGTHGIDTCQAAAANVLVAVVDELSKAGVDPAGIVLKPNMVVAGTGCRVQPGPEEVARRTLQVLTSIVSPAVPGIAFLSGGQTNAQACDNLRAINVRAATDPAAPWRLTFSFGRALVSDALAAWAGEPANIPAAREALSENCRRASTATYGSREVVQHVG
jgi:fructose-bisphosphate aldolase, class I